MARGQAPRVRRWFERAAAAYLHGDAGIGAVLPVVAAALGKHAETARALRTLRTGRSRALINEDAGTAAGIDVFDPDAFAVVLAHAEASFGAVGRFSATRRDRLRSGHAHADTERPTGQDPEHPAPRASVRDAASQTIKARRLHTKVSPAVWQRVRHPATLVPARAAA
jgi:hypothetical protein